VRIDILKEPSAQLFAMSFRRREHNCGGWRGQRCHRLGDRMIEVPRIVLVQHRRVRAGVPIYRPEPPKYGAREEN